MPPHGIFVPTLAGLPGQSAGAVGDALLAPSIFSDNPLGLGEERKTTPTRLIVAEQARCHCTGVGVSPRTCSSTPHHFGAYCS